MYFIINTSYKLKMNINKSKTLCNLENTFSKFIDYVNCGIKEESLNNFNSDETMLIIIDMINGFVNEGPLSSPYIKKMSTKLVEFAKECDERNIPIIAYRDAHDVNSREFKYFPMHCVKGTVESELINGLKNIDSIITVDKNSTNAFLARNPLNIVNKKIKNILVTGCVTDICVRDFSKTMNNYLNDKNIDATVYLVENLVETYDVKCVHDRELEHMLALYDMKNAGIKIIRIQV